jgi:hypothetical protein
VRLQFLKQLQDVTVADGMHKHMFFNELCTIIIPVLQEAVVNESGDLFVRCGEFDVLHSLQSMANCTLFAISVWYHS